MERHNLISDTVRIIPRRLLQILTHPRFWLLLKTYENLFLLSWISPKILKKAWHQSFLSKLFSFGLLTFISQLFSSIHLLYLCSGSLISDYFSNNASLSSTFFLVHITCLSSVATDHDIHLQMTLAFIGGFFFAQFSRPPPISLQTA